MNTWYYGGDGLIACRSVCVSGGKELFILGGVEAEREERGIEAWSQYASMLLLSLGCRRKKNKDGYLINATNRGKKKEKSRKLAEPRKGSMILRRTRRERI